VVKSPNDVYVENRKIAGVLVELRAQTGKPHLAVVGIGVNTNHQATDFSAPLRESVISLAMAARRPIDRQAFAILLLQDLDRTYRAIFAP
jgi:BirA family biotin operon repressor/biotin-[acetyl-CoA-carboxylase] ligase